MQDTLVGREIEGRYRVQRCLARGSSSRVYVAEHVGLRRPVALKVLEVDELVEDPDEIRHTRRRFRREASVLAALQHPNVVRVIDFWSDAHRSYLVMPLVTGPTLRQVLRERGALDPVRAVRIARQLCDGLASAHDAGLVHRDVKPANVLLSPGPDGDDVRLVDFGLARPWTDPARSLGNAPVGTPMCMAPEQIRGTRVDARADVYAVGVVLFQMLTGADPWPSDLGTAAVLLAHLDQPAPAPTTLTPHLPLALDWVVARCLEKRPADRFATAAELGAALAWCEAVLLESTLDGERPELVDGHFALSRPDDTPQDRGDGTWLAVALAGSLLAFVAGLAASLL